MIYGCCAASSEIMDYEAAENLAIEKLGENFVVEKNNSGSLFICYKIEETRNRLHILMHYFIYDVKSGRIIHEEKINDAAVKWFDEHNIEIKLTPEIISGDEDETGFIFNVITKEKQKRNFIN
jgi:hypothetical protein